MKNRQVHSGPFTAAGWNCAAVVVVMAAVAAGFVASGGATTAAAAGGMNASAQSNGLFTIVDTLGTATRTSTFPFAGSNGTTIVPYTLFGPRFVLTRPTVITEIGAFITSTPASDEGMVVFVFPAAPSGLPDTAPVAVFILSDDGNPDVYSYESVQTDLTLQPGTYFALFITDYLSQTGWLLANAPGYAAGVTTMSLSLAVGEETGPPVVDEYQGAVRILGRLALPTSRDQCKNDGWRNWPQFKSQGDCVSYVNKAAKK